MTFQAPASLLNDIPGQCGGSRRAAAVRCVGKCSFRSGCSPPLHTVTYFLFLSPHSLTSSSVCRRPLSRAAYVTTGECQSIIEKCQFRLKQAEACSHESNFSQERIPTFGFISCVCDVGLFSNPARPHKTGFQSSIFKRV